MVSRTQLTGLRTLRLTSCTSSSIWRLSIFLGRSVEERYGKWEFLRFYLVAIVLGGIYWTIRTWNGGNQGMVGASGGVTAVCMLFVFCFPRVEVLMMGVIPIPAWVLGVSHCCRQHVGRSQVAWPMMST